MINSASENIVAEKINVTNSIVTAETISRLPGVVQRYLAEIVWFPQAALSPYIKWIERDKNSAYAKMSYNGTQGDGVFFFDKEGNFEKFEAMRFKDVTDAQPTKWMVSAVKTELINGIKMPAQAQVVWELENGPWVWLQVKIVSTTLGKTI